MSAEESRASDSPLTESLRIVKCDNKIVNGTATQQNRSVLIARDNTWDNTCWKPYKYLLCHSNYFKSYLSEVTILEPAWFLKEDKKGKWSLQQQFSCKLHLMFHTIGRLEENIHGIYWEQKSDHAG